MLTILEATCFLAFDVHALWFFFLFWFGLGFFICLFKGVLCAVNENKKNGGNELEALVGYFPRMEVCVKRKFLSLWSGLVMILSWLLEDRPSSCW